MSSWIPVFGLFALIGIGGCLIALVIAKIKKKPLKPFVGALLVNFVVFSFAIGNSAKNDPPTKKAITAETSSQTDSSSHAAEKSSAPADKSSSETASLDAQPLKETESNTPAPVAPAVQPSAQTTTQQQNNVRRGDGPGPNGETIKGNINSKGEKIYHVPGGRFYNKTVPEVWFFTVEEAQAAVYRASKR